MNRLLWFLLGAAVMVGGQAMAQMSTWQDNQGHFGTIYSYPPMQQPNWMGPAQGMGQVISAKESLTHSR
jgi:hypothetical protein